MPYPYGTQNAPAVGNGLGGLPRRPLPPASPPPAPVLQAVAPYYLTRIGQRTNSNDSFAYSPTVIATDEYSDGVVSQRLFYNINTGFARGIFASYEASTRQIKTTGGNSTNFCVNESSNGNLSSLNCIKHDGSGMVSVTGFGSYANQPQNTACVETVNGVDNFYFMTTNNTTTTLIRVVPDYATQPAQTSPTVQTSINHGSPSRVAVGMFLSGDHLFVVAVSQTTTRTIQLERYDKNTLTFISSVQWNLSGTGGQTPGKGAFADTATMFAYRYESQSSFQERIFLIDKATLQGFDFSNGISGDASAVCRLISDSRDIYSVTGAGSGGSFGFTNIKMFRPGFVIDVASQSYSGATFSLASSVVASVPIGFSWGLYYPVSGSSQSTRSQIFAPSPDRIFSYSSGSGHNFSQSWSANPVTFTAGTAGGTVTTTANPYTAAVTVFNPRGTNYLAP